jgi:hypothetical protein
MPTGRAPQGLEVVSDRRMRPKPTRWDRPSTAGRTSRPSRPRPEDRPPKCCIMVNCHRNSVAPGTRLRPGSHLPGRRGNPEARVRGQNVKPGPMRPSSRPAGQNHAGRTRLDTNPGRPLRDRGHTASRTQPASSRRLRAMVLSDPGGTCLSSVAVTARPL